MIAKAVKPLAEKILADQTKANLPDYNKRFDSFQQVSKLDEQLKARGKLPELESGFTRGAPENKWQDPEAVHKTVVIESGFTRDQAPEKQIEKLQEQLDEQLGSHFDVNQSVTKSAIDQANEASRKFQVELAVAGKKLVQKKLEEIDANEASRKFERERK